MKMSKNSSSGGLNFTSLLLVAFIVLKLTHVIDWSWWWVLSPVWIPIAIFLAIIAAAYIVKAYDKLVNPGD
jgi:phosphoglycerol transferase MdoB-like AlkP superfamily enzyme